MKKHNIIYTVAIVICTILLLLVFLVFKKGSSSSAMTVSQEDFSRNIVYRDITPEVSEISNFIAKAEMPEDKQTTTYIHNIIQNALNGWTECQELVNSKKIKLQYKSGELYMASYEDVDNKAQYDVFLLSSEGKIKQCSKKTSFNEKDINEKGKSLYQLNFNDKNHNISRYVDYNRNEEVYFYSTGPIVAVTYNMPDGKKYSVSWSEDGKIISQGNYDKNNDSLSLESSKIAEQKIKKFQESAQKEYEEYLKRINSEENGSKSN
jgi:hypothetical protein